MFGVPPKALDMEGMGILLIRGGAEVCHNRHPTFEDDPGFGTISSAPKSQPLHGQPDMVSRPQVTPAHRLASTRPAGCDLIECPEDSCI